MADIDYPEGLPLPARDGYGVNHVNPLMRSDLVSGRARQRRRFTSTPSIINITWRMNESQTILFESWFQSVINDGASWFNCPLRTPMGTQPYEARFTGIYGPLTMDGLCGWVFSAEVELRERQVLQGEWAEVLPDFILNMDIFDMAMNREWPEYTFDYATYAEALSDFDNLQDGQIITIESDENNGGQHAQYEVDKIEGASLIANFSSQSYYIQTRPEGLYEVTVWA